MPTPPHPHKDWWGWRIRPALLRVIITSLVALNVPLTHPIMAQSLEDQLDEERFLRGLGEYRLPEVLEHYVASKGGGDPSESALYRIAALRLAANDPALAPAERLERIERMLEARRVLLAAHPHDERRALWLADQAADLLFLLYPHEATWLTAEFGLPTPAQLDRARSVAREVNDLAAEAELAIAELIINLEGEPGYAADLSKQLRRRRLSREERDRRVPYLRGVGAYLHAMFNVDDRLEQRAAFELASELLAPLVGELEGFLRPRARLYAGLALARLGRFDEADDSFRAVAGDGDATPSDVFAARMGAALNRAVTRGPAAGLEALDSIEERYTGAEGFFFRVLIADRRFLLRRQLAAQASPADRARLLSQAFASYTDLLSRDLGVPVETTRAVVFARLANAAGEDAPLEALPPIITVARAENLARDASTRARGVEMLEEALRRADLDQPTKAMAAFALGRALAAERRWLDAARRFEQVAREFPTDRQAETAIELAASILAEARAAAPDSADVNAQYESTLSMLLQRYPNLRSVERWRFEAGRLHYERGDLAGAREHFAAVAPGSAPWADSRFMLASVARAEALAEQDESRRAARLEAALAQIEKSRAAIRDAQSSEPEAVRREALTLALDRLTLHEAEMHLLAGRAVEALARLDSLGALEDRRLLGESMSLRIKAYHALGRSADVVREVTRFLDSIPDQAVSVAPSMLASLQDDVERLLDEDRVDEARRRARTDLLPLAEALSEWLATAPLEAETLPPLRVRLGDAFRAAGVFDRALSLYEDALRAQPGVLQAVFGRADCLFALARYEEAMIEFRRISTSRQEARDRYYWHAELRQLEILDRVNRNTQQIRPRIDRLRQVDPSLGGPRFKPTFDSLANKHR